MSLSRSDLPAHAGDAERAPDLDLAIDALGAVLGAMSEASSSETGTARLAAWHRHILVLEPPPGSDRNAPSHSRAWNGARTAALGWIEEETTQRDRSNDALQETLWALVKGVSNALQQEAVLDADTRACVERLRSAGQLPPGELQSAVLDAVDRLGAILDARREQHEETAASLGDRIRALSTDLESARREADCDALTRLANRGMFDRELERALDLAALTGEETTLVLVDVDHFKAVNDEHGHRIGDEVLKAVAKELVRTFPRRNDLVARYGGDEFAVILQHATADDAVRLLRRLMGRLAERELISDPEPSVWVSVSVGVAALGTSATPQDVIDAADRALYRSKHDGRGLVRVDGDSPPNA
jgi:diguanylate cyclase (GGDEF)-like protein